MQRHLVVDFETPGVPIQHYWAEQSAAEAFAAEATRLGLARVKIDDMVTDALPPLPYQRLYLPSKRNSPHLGRHCSRTSIGQSQTMGTSRSES
ncbi:hypothetical protein ACFU44_27150 [Nocardia rhizosphaerihabitans]|uniref:hypothetical protein n=1 Tax=Nocardia rhizosphaerihabitans TaxID=1691570 RepID=UPI003671A242